MRSLISAGTREGEGVWKGPVGAQRRWAPPRCRPIGSCWLGCPSAAVLTLCPAGSCWGRWAAFPDPAGQAARSARLPGALSRPRPRMTGRLRAPSGPPPRPHRPEPAPCSLLLLEHPAASPWPRSCVSHSGHRVSGTVTCPRSHRSPAPRYQEEPRPFHLPGLSQPGIGRCARLVPHPPRARPALSSLLWLGRADLGSSRRPWAESGYK